jgi:hypothetical protein
MIVDNPVDAAETLNTDLAKIHDWSMKWLVKFNPDKTESMIALNEANLTSATQTLNFNPTMLVEKLEIKITNLRFASLFVEICQ